ncbi:MAG: hypothetical protein CL912_16875 [Deltaproteobacteria bacterium]|nr:hypothetical protein [Deltaproteobacteria bacterium]
MPSGGLSAVTNQIFMPDRHKADSAVEPCQDRGEGRALERYTEEHIFWFSFLSVPNLSSRNIPSIYHEYQLFVMSEEGQLCRISMPTSLDGKAASSAKNGEGLCYRVSLSYLFDTSSSSFN